MKNGYRQVNGDWVEVQIIQFVEKTVGENGTISSETHALIRNDDGTVWAVPISEIKLK